MEDKIHNEIEALKLTNELLMKELSYEKELRKKLVEEQIIARKDLHAFIQAEVDKKITEVWNQLVETKIKELQDLKEALERSETLKEIRELAANEREAAISYFKGEYEKLKREAWGAYELALEEELAHLNIDKDIESFLNKKIKAVFSSLNNEEIEDLIRKIYDKSLTKINFQVSKNIKDKLCEMSILQGDILNEAVLSLELRKNGTDMRRLQNGINK